MAGSTHQPPLDLTERPGLLLLGERVGQERPVTSSIVVLTATHRPDNVIRGDKRLTGWPPVTIQTIPAVGPPLLRL